jgi:hypothetical protein
MSWWNRPFLPSADLRPGQRVEVIGEGPVTVVNGNPHGSHSRAFTALREGDDEPVFFSRSELKTPLRGHGGRAAGVVVLLLLLLLLLDIALRWK